jgi:hypothetical protein
MWSKWSQPNLRFYPDIYVEELRRTVNPIIIDVWEETGNRNLQNKK